MAKKKSLWVLWLVLGILVALVLVVVLVFFVVPISQGNGKVYGTYENALNSATWMASLSDDVYIQNVNLPGTHDSASQYVELPYFSRCQAKSIRTQLNDGYRYLDIRLGIETGDDQSKNLKLMHGFCNCKKGKSNSILYLDAVLDDCYAFLRENPTETIVFCVKQEHGNESVAEFQQILADVIGKNPEMWYTQNGIPSLGELRGKLFLLRRYENEANSENAGFNIVWRDQGNHEIANVPYEINVQKNGIAVFVEDRFKYDADDKWDAFTTSLEFATNDNKDDTIYINFLSTNGDTKFGHPLKYASPLNKKFWAYSLTDGKRIGWIILDFATTELAAKVYMTNF